MIALLEVMTLTDVDDKVATASAAAGVDIPPSPGASSWASAYFIVFTVIGAFFVSQLFVGVVIQYIAVAKKSALLTDKQRLWVDIQRVLLGASLRKPPSAPAHPLRALVFRVVEHRAFEMFITAVIILNSITLCVEYPNRPANVGAALDALNVAYVAVFAVEIVLKLAAYGPREYLKDAWNVFDAAVVVGSIVTSFFDAIRGAIQIARAFRLVRLVRIFRRAKGVRVLVNTIFLSLPSFGNIFIVLLVVLFIYAVTGVYLFADLRLQTHINQNSNFRTFWNAFVLCFEMMTLEGWNRVMYDARIAAPACSPSGGAATLGGGWGGIRSVRGDCGVAASDIYFISFVIILAYIFLSLLIAVILENLQMTISKDASPILEQHFEDFRAAWLRFDPEGEGFIPAYALNAFLNALEPPLVRRDRIWLKSIHIQTRQYLEEKGLQFRWGGGLFPLDFIRKSHRGDAVIYFHCLTISHFFVMLRRSCAR
jgi:hypothetical protein